jgi:apolipoprotein N-acyltransferase
MEDRSFAELAWPLGASLATALALALADAPAYAAPLQLVAFAPFLVAARRWKTWRMAALSGAALSVRFVFFAPALGALPPPSRAGILAYVLAWHAVFGLACFALRRLNEPARSIAVAGSFVALELVDAHLPMWGTALSLACAWTTHPSALRIVQLTGPSGVAFVVVAVQSLALAWLRERRARNAVALGIVVAGATLTFAGIAQTGQPTSKRSLRLAVLGWSARDDGQERLDGLVADAARRGARLVVSPEAVYDVAPEARQARLAELGEMARRHGVYLAVGYLDEETRRNRVVVFDSAGQPLGDYEKTHLVPLAEKMEAGEGRLLLVPVDGVAVGIVICQDDNFADLARLYARAGAELLVSPTYEMSPAMGRLHLRNALLRPIETRLPYARAAARGTSAIVSGAGVVLASYDHVEGGPAALVADVPLASTAR